MNHGDWLLHWNEKNSEKSVLIIKRKSVLLNAIPIQNPLRGGIVYLTFER